MSVSRHHADPDTVLDTLRQQVADWDPEQYPVQYATACFHLGATLIGRGELEEAARTLAHAAQLFPADGMPVEHAKAMNMLGVALRDDGQASEAAIAFERAVELFTEQEQVLELAAARFNHGLVLRDLDRDEDARAAFAEALETFDEADAREAACSSARELGTTLLDLDELEDAATALERAIDLARRGAGREALGAAANVLGIVHLRAGNPDLARDAFVDAAGAHPRSVRPEPYAMARANVALACERLGEADPARLAARQALAIPVASQDVRDQAQGVLDRVGDDPAALIRSLDDAPAESWVASVREELRRLTEVPDDELQEHLDAWVAGLVERDDQGTELAAAWFDVILELPPDDMRRLLEALSTSVDGRPSDEAEDLRDHASRAMARFHVPQWMRLRDTLNDIARQRDQEPPWK